MGPTDQNPLITCHSAFLCAETLDLGIQGAVHPWNVQSLVAILALLGTATRNRDHCLIGYSESLQHFPETHWLSPIYVVLLWLSFGGLDTASPQIAELGIWHSLVIAPVLWVDVGP